MASEGRSNLIVEVSATLSQVDLITFLIINLWDKLPFSCL